MVITKGDVLDAFRRWEGNLFFLSWLKKELGVVSTNEQARLERVLNEMLQAGELKVAIRGDDLMLALP
jgi:hypothetical protein